MENFSLIANCILLALLLYLCYRILKTYFFLPPTKPFKWEEAVEKGVIPKKLLNIEKKYADKVRFYNFWLQIERIKQANIAGAFVELGVYKGETAKMIHEMAPDRTLYLFDTFEGFDSKDLAIENGTDKKYNTKEFADTTLDAVVKYIDGNENVQFIKGYFPETLSEIAENCFALIHLDADLYKPTLDALKHFYPLLSKGGIIIIHDYNHNWDGVRKAVDEFKTIINEPIIELCDWQGSAMIIKSE